MLNLDGDKNCETSRELYSNYTRCMKEARSVYRQISFKAFNLPRLFLQLDEMCTKSTLQMYATNFPADVIRPEVQTQC